MSNIEILKEEFSILEELERIVNHQLHAYYDGESASFELNGEGHIWQLDLQSQKLNNVPEIITQLTELKFLYLNHNQPNCPYIFINL